MNLTRLSNGLRNLSLFLPRNAKKPPNYSAIVSGVITFGIKHNCGKAKTASTLFTDLVKAGGWD